MDLLRVRKQEAHLGRATPYLRFLWQYQLHFFESMIAFGAAVCNIVSDVAGLL